MQVVNSLRAAAAAFALVALVTAEGAAQVGIKTGPVRGTAMTPEVALPGANNPNNGKFPAGWSVRNDTSYAHDAKDSLKLVTKGAGWSAKSGPSSIVWRSTNVAKGTFVVAAQTFLYPPTTASLPAYGVFFGGTDLKGPHAAYTEFLVRNDGKFAVRQHSGVQTVMLKDWTAMPGIVLHSGRFDEMAGNRFRIIVDGGMVQFAINRVVAFSLPTSVVHPDGAYGVRIGTRQEVEIANIGLEKIVPSVKPPAVGTPRHFTPAPKPHAPGAVGVPTGQRRG
jgi:hypothetical protein